MAIVVTVIQFLSGLSLLVFVHELGHFLAAKAFGIKVKKFYMFFDGFGWRLFRFNYKGTEFGMGWIPLGGYVALEGVPDSQIDLDSKLGSSEVQLFHRKPVWKRVVVMISGIVSNIVLAFIIYCSLFLIYGRNQISGIGKPVLPGQLGIAAGIHTDDQVAAINADSLLYEDELLSTHLMHGNTVLSIVRKQGSEKVHLHLAVSPKIMQLVADKGLTQFFSIRADFKVDSIYTNVDLRNNKDFKNAHITALNGDSVRSYNDFIIKLNENKERQLYLTVIHDGVTSTMPAHRDKDGHIGFSMNDRLPLIKPEKVSLTQSFGSGGSRVWRSIKDNTKGLAQMANGEVSIKEGLLGPIRIASLFTSNFNPQRFWGLVSLLSIALAVFNLIPLPPLDGGSIAVLLFEGLSGLRVSMKFWSVYNMIGFIAIILISGYVIFNDIRALI